MPQQPACIRLADALYDTIEAIDHYPGDRAAVPKDLIVTVMRLRNLAALAVGHLDPTWITEGDDPKTIDGALED